MSQESDYKAAKAFNDGILTDTLKRLFRMEEEIETLNLTPESLRELVEDKARLDHLQHMQWNWGEKVGLMVVALKVDPACQDIREAIDDDRERPYVNDTGYVGSDLCGDCPPPNESDRARCAPCPRRLRSAIPPTPNEKQAAKEED